MKVTTRQNALVTGGASGIGFSIVERLLMNGLNVVVLDKNVEMIESAKRKLSHFGDLIEFVKVDLGSSQKIEMVLKRLKDKNVSIKYLINNAGYQENVDLFDLTLSQWHEMFRVHTDAAFLLSQHLAKSMVRHNIDGCIINITSIHSCIIRGIVHYSASKAALELLTKELAYSLAKYKIRVNAIAPGAIDTPLIRKDLNNTRRRRQAGKQIPLGTLGNSNDIASVVEFLISDKARYITGTTITVDGGLSLVI